MRAANVKALTDGALLALHRDDFNALLGSLTHIRHMWRFEALRKVSSQTIITMHYTLPPACCPALRWLVGEQLARCDCTLNMVRSACMCTYMLLISHHIVCQMEWQLKLCAWAAGAAICVAVSVAEVAAVHGAAPAACQGRHCHCTQEMPATHSM